MVGATHGGVPVRLADPFSIGVLESAAADEYRRTTTARAPYIGRSIDRKLRSAIAALGAGGGIIVVTGRPKAGKSRTMWEALAATPATRDRTLYALRPPDGRAVEGADSPFTTFLDADPHLDGSRTVIWVDDAHEHFEYGLTMARLSGLLDRHPGLIVAMTVHTHRLDAPPRSDGELTAVDAELLRYLRALGEGHELAVELDEKEQATARPRVPRARGSYREP